MKIVIEKSESVEQLHLLSAQMGLKLQAPEIVASVEDDEERIEPLWRSAVAELSQLLAPYATFLTAENKAEYNLSMPDNWDILHIDALQQHCEIFILNSLLFQWLYFVHPESANVYKAMNAERAAAITELLTMRKKPQIQ